MRTQHDGIQHDSCRIGIDRVPIWWNIDGNRQMCLNDKRAYTENSARITKDFVNESNVRYVPAGIPKLATLFGTCRFKRSWGLFRSINRGVIVKQAIYALRHIRRSVRSQCSANLSDLPTSQNYRPVRTVRYRLAEITPRAILHRLVK